MTFRPSILDQSPIVSRCNAADAATADALMAVTITADYASRRRSCELLAAEFGLAPVAGLQA